MSVTIESRVLGAEKARAVQDEIASRDAKPHQTFTLVKDNVFPWVLDNYSGGVADLDRYLGNEIILVYADDTKGTKSHFIKVSEEKHFCEEGGGKKIDNCTCADTDEPEGKKFGIRGCICFGIPLNDEYKRDLLPWSIDTLDHPKFSPYNPRLPLPLEYFFGYPFEPNYSHINNDEPAETGLSPKLEYKLPPTGEKSGAFTLPYNDYESNGIPLAADEGLKRYFFLGSEDGRFLETKYRVITETTDGRWIESVVTLFPDLFCEKN